MTGRTPPEKERISPYPALAPGLVATPYRFAFHLPTRTAILSDVHLGVEETLGKQGIFMPDVTTGQLRERFGQVAKIGPSRVIIAGDLFDGPTPSERTVAFCAEMLAGMKCPVTIIPGNHDPDRETLLALLPQLDIAIEPYVRLGDVFVSHGHDMTMEEVARRSPAVWVVGHQHPALQFATAVQKAKMACFAVCDFPGRLPGRMVLLPAFSGGPLGSNLLTLGNWLLPVERPGNERVAIWGLVEGSGREPRVLPFGTLAMHASPKGDR